MHSFFGGEYTHEERFHKTFSSHVCVYIINPLAWSVLPFCKIKEKKKYIPTLSSAVSIRKSFRSMRRETKSDRMPFSLQLYGDWTSVAAHRVCVRSRWCFCCAIASLSEACVRAPSTCCSQPKPKRGHAPVGKKRNYHKKKKMHLSVVFLFARSQNT